MPGIQTPFEVAIENNDLAALKNLLEEENIDANAKEICGENLIHIAARQGSEEIVKYLTKTGCGLKDLQGVTALHLAAFHGHYNIVEYLLLHAEAPASARTNFGDSPLHLAARDNHKDIVQLLIETRVVDINAQDRGGNTALHIAASSGYEELVEYLLKRRDIKPNLKNSAGETAFNYASYIAHKDIIELFIKYVGNDPESEVDSHGRTPLHYAVIKENKELIKYLIFDKAVSPEFADCQMRTPLHYAVMDYDIDIVKWLVDSGANPNAKSSLGMRPLHFAMCFEGVDIAADPNIKINFDLPLRKPCSKLRKQIIEYLLNLRDDEELPVVNSAVYACGFKLPFNFVGMSYGHETLLTSGARKDPDPLTKRMINRANTAEYFEQIEDIIDKKKSFYEFLKDNQDYLIQTTFNKLPEKPKKFIFNNYNITQIDSDKFERISQLLRSAAYETLKEIEPRRYFGWDEIIILHNFIENSEFITHTSSEIRNNYIDLSNQRAMELKESYEDSIALEKQVLNNLEQATSENDSLMFGLYLERLKEINAGNSSKILALELAVTNKYDNPELIRAFKECMQSEIDLNKLCLAGKTPLNIAILRGNANVAAELVDLGADVNYSGDFLAKTPLHYAAEMGEISIAKKLLDNSANISSKTLDSSHYYDVMYCRDTLNRAFTPIHIAAFKGNTEMVKLLYSRAADINETMGVNGEEETVSTLAYCSGSEELNQFLKENNPANYNCEYSEITEEAVGFNTGEYLPREVKTLGEAEQQPIESNE
jgi:ankyrin repeat protein